MTYKKRLSRLFLAIRNLAVSNPSQGYGNDRRLSGMITIGTGVCASIHYAVYIIRREAPRCSFHLDGHMPEPRIAGRASGMALTLFPYKPIHSLRGESDGNNGTQMCDSSTNTTWESIIRRYATGRRSDFDVSLAVRVIIEKIRREIPGVKSDWQVEKNFSLRPLEYIYVSNKSVGPHNLPMEPYRFTALTECELTFYQNKANTLRYRYFIQLTHGRLIHGLSWVKASSEIQFDSKDFEKVRRYVTEIFLKEESDADILPCKAKYGIYDGHSHLIGVMYNKVVKGFGSGKVLMEKEVIDKMSALMKNAFTFFKENERTIINIINQTKQQ